MKAVKSLEECGLLIIGVSETIKNETQEQKGGFISMLLDKLGTSLFGNLLADKGVKKSNIPGHQWSSGRGVMIASEGTIRAGQNF